MVKINGMNIVGKHSKRKTRLDLNNLCMYVCISSMKTEHEPPLPSPSPRLYTIRLFYFFCAKNIGNVKRERRTRKNTINEELE